MVLDLLCPGVQPLATGIAIQLIVQLATNLSVLCLFFSQKTTTTTTTYFQLICSPGLVKIQTGLILHFPLLSAVLLSH